MLGLTVKIPFVTKPKRGYHGMCPICFRIGFCIQILCALAGAHHHISISGSNSDSNDNKEKNRNA